MFLEVADNLLIRPFELERRLLGYFERFWSRRLLIFDFKSCKIVLFHLIRQKIFLFLSLIQLIWCSFLHLLDLNRTIEGYERAFINILSHFSIEKITPNLFYIISEFKQAIAILSCICILFCLYFGILWALITGRGCFLICALAQSGGLAAHAEGSVSQNVILSALVHGLR